MRQVLFVVLVCAPALALADNAPKSDTTMLADAAWLVTQLNAQAIDQSGDEREAQTLVLLDVRADEKQRTVKPPGAITIDAAEWKKAFKDGTDAEEWTERIGGVLKNKDATVVVLDEKFTPTAARIWWILKYWGVKDVRVLDGGFADYKRAGGLIVAGERGPSGHASNFTAKPHPERLVTFDQMQEIIGNGGESCLVDTRSEGENTAGYIPSATHLDWQELVDPETGKLRSKDELKKLLARVEFDPTTRTVTYCRSGGRASVMAFAMELVSGKPVANYYGSWSDWTRRGGEQAVNETSVGR